MRHLTTVPRRNWVISLRAIKRWLHPTTVSGLGVVLLGALGSCRTEKPSPFVTYYQEISNETTHQITLALYARADRKLLGSIPVAPQSQVVLEYKQEDRFTPFYKQGRPDSVAIIFDDAYLLAHRLCRYDEGNCSPGRNMLLASDYQMSALSTKESKYRYLLTEADFRAAKKL
jgi:hypothetical protein